MYFGKMIAGYKIIINDQASADYKEYRRTKALKESIREISDPDEIKKYALTRKCPFCNQLTEDDSKYCSICGKRLMDQLLKEIDTAVDSQDERSEYQKIVDVYGDDTEELINYWAILYGFKLEQDKIGPSFYSQMREGLLKNIKEEKGADFCEKIINIENYLDQEKLAKEVDVVNGIESGKYHVRLKNNNIQILVNN